jgi:hypothetical protein
MRKDYRQNYRAGTNPFGRKSNLQKIADTFGPKKKVKKNKKPTKRMFANKGGGADTGRMGEIKSQVTVASDKIRKLLEKLNRPKKGSIKQMLKEDDRKKLNEMLKQQNNPKDLPRGLRMDTTTGEGANMIKMAKGGSAKKKKKFPDISGDGKVTMKDVLMARGVIPKKKKTKKKVI